MRLRWGLGCVGAAALTLLVLRVPAYDPTAWLLWGREVLHGDLSTQGGPSWKPLPVGFTTLFAVTGESAAAALWLLVARAAGFAAVVLAYTLARRLAGRVAGVVAAAALLLGTGYLFQVLRGDSEGMLVALGLGAVLLELDGHRRAAFVLAVLAAGLRPEVWPLVAVYCAWLAWRDRRLVPVVLLAGLVVLAAWFLPDYLAAGDVLRSADRATDPVRGTPGSSPFPFASALWRDSAFVLWPLYAPAALAVWEAARTRERTRLDVTVLVLGAGAALMMLVIAVLAQAGFTGNIRYATLPGALIAVLAGAGVPALARSLPQAWRPYAAVVGTVAIAIAVVGHLDGLADRTRQIRADERVLGGGLRRAFAAVGGERAVRRCGRVATTRLSRQTVAYRLGLPSSAVATRAVDPGVTFVRRGGSVRAADTLPVIATTGDWIIRRRC